MERELSFEKLADRKSRRPLFCFKGKTKSPSKPFFVIATQKSNQKVNKVEKQLRKKLHIFVKKITQHSDILALFKCAVIFFLRG